MTKPIRPRRIVALIAAYVVALQALLLPLSVVAGAAADFSLCTSASRGAPQPANHDTSCPCAAGCGMQCCVSALAAPPQTGGILVRSGVRIALPPVIASVTRPYLRTPQLARAPPAA